MGWLADFMSTEDFYARLVAERNLEACLRRGACVPLPEDWDLAVADVAGSTRAIEAGRYKEVNVVAASAIVAVLTPQPRDTAFYKQRLARLDELSHVTVEVTRAA